MKKRESVHTDVIMDVSGIKNLGLDCVLRRGSAEILENTGTALLLRDRVSGVYLLACEDAEAGLELLDRSVGMSCALLIVTNYALGMAAFERYGFLGKLACYQVAYFGEKPLPDPGLLIRTAEESDLPLLIENYHLITPEELRMVVERRSILLGYRDGQPVGFIGEHLEGSMGILFVFPEYRRRGFGTALQKALIARTMEQGRIPFGQVAEDNHASLCLQEKLGMTRSDERIVFMWR